MTHYTEPNLKARIERVCAIRRRDVNRFKPNPLGPGFLTRAERYRECIWELERRLTAVYDAITTEEDLWANGPGEDDYPGAFDPDRERFNCNQ